LNNLFSDEHHLQKDAIGGLVNYLITSINLVDLNQTSADIDFDEPLLRYNAVLPSTTGQALQIFKDFVLNFVIKQTSIQRLEYRGQQIVMELFEALSSDPLRLLPKNSAKRYQIALDNDDNTMRVIADYVSGMTDDYASRLHQALFVSNASNAYQLT
jgi:dGTPase